MNLYNNIKGMMLPKTLPRVLNDNFGLASKPILFSIIMSITYMDFLVSQFEYINNLYNNKIEKKDET